MQRSKYRAAVVLVLFLVLIAVFFFFRYQPKRILLAPMIGGLNFCLFKKEELAKDLPNSRFTKLCLADPQSASQLIEATLHSLSGGDKTNHEYRLGYTLYIPLLKLFENVNGVYKINNEYI